MPTTRERLQDFHAELAGCRACPRVVGTPVHPSAQPARILLVGQAPGPREASLGKAVRVDRGAHALRVVRVGAGADEETVRQHVYLAAVTRCFPGKAPGRRRPAAGSGRGGALPAVATGARWS